MNPILAVLGPLSKYTSLVKGNSTILMNYTILSSYTEI